MKLNIPIFCFCLTFSFQAYSSSCYYNSGETDVHTDLSDSFTSANNKVGAIITKDKSFAVHVIQVICNPYPTNPYNPDRDSTWRSYLTHYPVVEIIDSFKYIKVNDYLNAAISIYDPAVGTFYPPVTDVGPLCCNKNVGLGLPYGVRDKKFELRFKVTKRFINFIHIPHTKLFDVYSNTGPGEPLGPVIYTISYSGSIEVPQSCIVNADQIVEFDFGKIGSQLFTRAGAGNKPDLINPITKNVAIKCTNVDAADAILSIRVQAESATGDMINSSNPDVGFKMSATTNMHTAPYSFIPNNINSHVPFKLDENSYTNIPVTAWPISKTGKAPAVGIFTARGYLRVDYF